MRNTVSYSGRDLKYWEVNEAGRRVVLQPRTQSAKETQTKQGCVLQ